MEDVGSSKTMGELLEVAAMRKPYRDMEETFDVQDLAAKEPFKQFSAWFQQAKSNPGISEPNAMALATATRDGKPSVRMVLLRGIDTGFVFYTNYLSRKAQELVENPHCSLAFFWEAQHRSVRIEGSVEKVDCETATNYFHSRPHSSQIGACVSVKQSAVVESRQVLNDRNDELHKQYPDSSFVVPKPDYWGGFRIVPHRFEFWQGQSNRLHDRIVFRKPQEGEIVDSNFTYQGEEGWVYERLMP